MSVKLIGLAIFFGMALSGCSSKEDKAASAMKTAEDACKNAIWKSTDPDFMLSMATAGGGPPVPTVANPDGSFLVTDVQGGARYLHTRIRMVAKCEYRDGQTTVVQPYKDDGLAPQP